MDTAKKKYYNKNKDKILADAKTLRLNDKKMMLLEKGFSEELAPWVRINPECITLCFSDMEDIEKFLLIDNLNKTVKTKDEIEIDRNEILEILKSIRLQPRKDLLIKKNFPDLIAPWARINKQTVSLAFSTHKDFEKFLAIRHDILTYCNKNKIKNETKVEPNSNI